MKTIAPLALALFLGAPLAGAGDEGARAQVETPILGNRTCPFSGKPVRPDKYVERNGERVYVCCNKCRAKAKKDFETAYAKAYPADSVRDLGNPTCPIMGNKAKEDVTVTVQGMKVHMCCKRCEKKLRGDLQARLALLTHPDLVDLGNERCLVTPEEESVPGSFFVYDGVLIRTCCDDCKDEFAADPQKFLDEAGVDLEKVKAEARAKKAQKMKGEAGGMHHRSGGMEHGDHEGGHDG